MKYLLILVSLCMGIVSYGQIKQQQRFAVINCPSVIYMNYRGKNPHVVDSFLGYHYWIYNSKKVPEEGLYADTCLWRMPEGNTYIISVFYNQKLIASSGFYRKKGDDSYLDIYIDPKIKPKHK